ncbi:putative NADPH-dependent fmn reductase [Treponema primitia ZAS-2]|uniref:Putative NADPH-dependent fmn reductase n=1 Tax=Treponema primitia (strain ATCC BAA-887 / DSM 12427 / ZAS-2) TaxID=545694 RepID=F5YKI0_TREPZ|nr:flavodoxin family protein [Treponema primitia]AEF86037.1 putative NADPH-dependent fmn reductase [Treponema primitia ZAS-2]
MKKILVINGSGRKEGNAAGLASQAIESMKKAGTEAKLFNLGEMNIHPCVACNGCKTGTGGCVQKDELSSLIDDMLDCDGILLTSPIYFGRATAQVYIWVNRLYSLMSSAGSRCEKKESRKLGVILTFNSGPADVYAKEADYLAMGGVKMVAGITAHNILLAGGLSDKDAYKSHTEYLDKAKVLGEWLVQ